MLHFGAKYSIYNIYNIYISIEQTRLFLLHNACMRVKWNVSIILNEIYNVIYFSESIVLKIK